MGPFVLLGDILNMKVKGNGLNCSDFFCMICAAHISFLYFYPSVQDEGELTGAGCHQLIRLAKRSPLLFLLLCPCYQPTGLNYSTLPGRQHLSLSLSTDLLYIRGSTGRRKKGLQPCPYKKKKSMYVRNIKNSLTPPHPQPRRKKLRSCEHQLVTELLIQPPARLTRRRNVTAAEQNQRR